MGLFSFFSREKKEDLNQGLSKTKEAFFTRLSRAIAGKSTVDDDVLDALEETLVSSDVGVETTLKIIEHIQQRVSKDKYLGTKELNRILKEEMASLLQTGNNMPDDFTLPEGVKRPYVILVVGVNGVGKTTTIGKLAYQFKKAGNQVLLGAADTFRAAAVEQLQIWGDRVGVPVISQGSGADPAAVAYDTVKSAVARKADVVIIDTAGRLHNRVNLMNELGKIRNVLKKVMPEAPQEVLARQFSAATDVTALAVTKLDGTAKGGVVIGISDQFRIPVRYIGVGEKMEQLQVFNREAFVETLFEGV